MYKSVIVAISIAASLSWIAPAQAFPVVNSPVVAAAPSAATEVDWNGHHGRVFFNHGGHDFRDRGRFNGGGRYYRHGGYYGHGGYYRHGYYGYRNGGDAGAIIGGLAAGAIIGGALAAPRYSGSHAGYCASRYRTYRASDNTYQPSNGPRRQCR